jgi:protease II
MTKLELENLKGQELAYKFINSSRWETVELTKFKDKFFSAIFKKISSNKFVFVSIERSNTGRTEYWIFDEEPSGFFLLKLFKNSHEWEEINFEEHSSNNDHDFRSSSIWLFRHLNGKEIKISKKSSNRSGNSSKWFFSGNKSDIPDFNSFYEKE